MIGKSTLALTRVNLFFPEKIAYYLRKITLGFFLLAFFALLLIIANYKFFHLTNGSFATLFWAYGLLSSIFLLSRFLVSFYYKDEHGAKPLNMGYPSVSFVIACKDEEDSIAKTINTCLMSNYPGKMECVAINDGSSDNTLKEMKKMRTQWKTWVKIIDFKENRGKREAMAEGVLAAKGEIIIFVDSDSFPKRDAARIIVEHFLLDDKVGAVSGNSLVENSDANLLTKMQSGRYGVSFDVFKSAESVFGAVTCCPGCFSAYRRNAILEVLDEWRYQTFLGTRSTFGDDRSLTNYILRNRKVVYCRSAIATTIVPEHYRKFFKQQLRWKKSWIREGMNSGSFMWKKHPAASIAFYINLLIPIFAPIVAFRALFIFDAAHLSSPITYLLGLMVMSLLFGVYYYLISSHKHWWYLVPFTLLYSTFLIWQMPYAILKLRDTRWGTR